MIRRLILLILVAPLAGCFLPADFEARLSALRDGRVQLSFEGQLIHLPGAFGNGEAGAPGYDSLLAALRADRRVRAVSDEGGGRYRIDYRVTTRLAPGETLAFPPAGDPWLTLRRGRDGVARLETRGFNAEETLAIRRLGVNLRGVLTLDAKTEVQSHNGGVEAGMVDEAIRWTFADGASTAARATLLMDR